MNDFLQRISIKHILLFALVLRLVSAIFSQGYGMHDDHFLVIEVAQNWLDGRDDFHWFESYEDSRSGRAILYPGMHYVLFYVLEGMGMTDPVAKMYVVRILHALYSLLIPLFAFKIARLWGYEKEGKIIALVLSCLWFMPYVSVRNLAEVVAIPPLLVGSYLILKHLKTPKAWWPHLLGGVILTLSFSMRYQTSVYIIGFGLGLMFLKEWKPFLLMALGGLVLFGTVHGLGDYLITGVPFGKVIFYVEYNLKFAQDYITQPWYQYLGVIPIFLVPPLGALWFIGSFKTEKKQWPVFFGTLVFLIIHSMLEGKQERFMFTILPFYILMGVIGWQRLTLNWTSNGWRRTYRGFWIFFLVVNLIGVVFITPWYSKKSRVEVMVHMQQYDDVQGIILADETNGSTNMLPKYYMGHWATDYPVDQYSQWEPYWTHVSTLEQRPNYLLIERRPWEPEGPRLAFWEEKFTKLEKLGNVEGSFMDRKHFKANKVVKADEYIVCRIVEW